MRSLLGQHFSTVRWRVPYVHPGPVILDQKGKVLDAEVVQSSDPALAASALDVVWHSSYLPAERRNRPLQREAFINVRFTPAS